MNAEPHSLREGDALLVVDVQNDFCPGGALGITDGDAVVPILNEWIRAAEEKGLPVILSRDWHPLGHPSFAEEGGPWPAHCVQDTPGAAFHADLALPRHAILVSKGTRFDKDQYSAFDETGLGHALRKLGVRRVWIGGLAQDVCIRATALDAGREGFETFVIEAATRPITPEDGKNALADMRRTGIGIA